MLNSEIKPTKNKSEAGMPSDKLLTQVSDLQEDNSKLYFILGALTDAFDDLNELAKAEFLKSLESKCLTAEPEYKDALLTLMEAMNRE